ncbi:uncharacterized protein TrAtP1_010260 [Trichoderma atroviride]|uniref:uncharacterized protein n=1 Tax=Hypocrea atroviridis TaxID=63577 RepID=UPI0033245658|nr:hypothetical protein TrAtP1_010260 [Trichoderma atroviride]
MKGCQEAFLSFTHADAYLEQGQAQSQQQIGGSIVLPGFLFSSSCISCGISTHHDWSGFDATGTPKAAS